MEVLTFLEFAHMVHATQWMGWSGADVNGPSTCNNPRT